MKKYLFFVTVLMVKISCGQYCGSAGSFECSVDSSLTSFGITNYNSFPCVHDSVPYHEVVQLFFPDTILEYGFPAQIYSVHIDSITNLPCGLCWSCNDSSFTYAGGTKGCILFSGTTNDLHGAYQLNIYGTDSTGFGNFSGTLGSFGYQFFLNVVGQNDSCTPINFANLNTSCSTGGPPPAPTCIFNAQVSSSNPVVNCVFDSTTLTVISPVGPGYQYEWVLLLISFEDSAVYDSGASVEVTDSFFLADLVITDSVGCQEDFPISISYAGPVYTSSGICYATADSSLPNSNGINLVFEKDDWFNNVTSYQLYRQNAPSTFPIYIGQTGLGEPGIITDSDPISYFTIYGFNGTLWDEYSLSFTTACDTGNGNYGQGYFGWFTPSTLGVDTLPNGLPQLIWNNSIPITYNQVYIYSRYPGANWRLRYSTINLMDTVWVDQQPDSTNMQYMLGYALTVTCDPERAASTTAFSNFGTTIISPNVVHHDTVSNTSGIKPPPYGLEDILIYPNPADDKLYLQIAGANSLNQLSYKIYDMLGRLIAGDQLTAQSRNELKTEALSSGVYTISLQVNDREPAIRKFVKR